MDITEALRRTENALRDFVAQVLHAKYGHDWEHNSGIDPKTVQKWERTKRAEQEKQRNGVVEPRLIYYADFADLTPILERHWADIFEPAFEVDLPTMTVWLQALRTVRNQEAHGRELLEHQKQLALGAAGEIRTRLIRHRSKLETAEDYFPRLERVNDDLGNVWVAGEEKVVRTTHVLHPGDILTFTVTASDPRGAEPEYSVVAPHFDCLDWRKDKVLVVEIKQADIRRECDLEIYIRGTSGSLHANGLHWDDTVKFVYTVLPNKNSTGA